MDWLNSYKICSAAYSYRKGSGRISKGRMRMSAAWRANRRVMLVPHFCSSYLCWTPPAVTFPCLEISFSLSSNKAIFINFNFDFLCSQVCVHDAASLFPRLTEMCPAFFPFPLIPPLSSLPLFRANFMCCVFKLPGAGYICTGAGESTEKWVAFQGPHLWGKLSPL